MSKLLIDTNIVLDLLAKRQPFYEAAASLFSLADKNKLCLSVSSLTLATTNYILTKSKPVQEVREILRQFRILVRVLPISDKTVDLALNDLGFKDFEDGLQYHAAVENNQDIIVTRNLKDFKASAIPVMTAETFLKLAGH